MKNREDRLVIEVRLPKSLVREARDLFKDRTLSQIIDEALKELVGIKKRTARVKRVESTSVFSPS